LKGIFVDNKLGELIRKHAAKNGMTIEKGVRLYIDFNERIRQLIDELDKNDIKEIRVPWLLRFKFNIKHYDKYIKQREKTKGKDTTI